MKAVTIRVTQYLPVLGVLLSISIVPAFATANPYDWFTLSGTDPLNYEATGPNGDYVMVSNMMGGVGWGNTSLISNQYAAVANPGQYVVMDNALAKGGDLTVFCTTPACRNHARLWGIPFRNSSDSIQTVSTEHWPGGFTHIVDSFNDGRDAVFWDLWPYAWVRSGWYTPQYGANCTPQPDTTCAPYDGQVAYEYISF